MADLDEAALERMLETLEGFKRDHPEERITIAPNEALRQLMDSHRMASYPGIVRDGITLRAIPHPRAPWWKRWRTWFRKPSPESLETIEVERATRYRYRRHPYG